MKSILKNIKPTGLVIMLFLLMLMFQLLFTIPTYHTITDESKTFIGFGSITIIEKNYEKSIHINWAILILNLLICYLLAVILYKVITKVTHSQRPFLKYLLLVGIIISMTFIFSIIVSKKLWNYYFKRPSILSEVTEIVQVNFVIPIITKPDNSGSYKFYFNPDYKIEERISWGEKDSYYCLEERILIYLKKKNLLPANPEPEIGNLSNLFFLISKSDFLVKPDEIYDDSDLLMGIIVDAIDKNNERLIIVGATSRQISNDHYAYYECVFRELGTENKITFIRGQYFFYDSAGIEGLEWYVIWLVSSLWCIFISFPIFTLILARYIKQQLKRKSVANKISSNV
ncbi:hypothetical protein KAU33_03175 [Candidatus Dependentiae bacterium]|nr:hypothetical protein [Candidatus Dependentiae bacterium]